MFDLYASRLSAAAAIVSRVGKAINGKGVEAGEEPEDHSIALTGPANVLQQLIDTGDLERIHLDGDEFEECADWGRQLNFILPALSQRRLHDSDNAVQLSTCESRPVLLWPIDRSDRSFCPCGPCVARVD